MALAGQYWGLSKLTGAVRAWVPAIHDCSRVVLCADMDGGRGWLRCGVGVDVEEGECARLFLRTRMKLASHVGCK